MPATIRAAPSHFDNTLPSISHQTMLQEFSGNQNSSRKTSSGQRGAFWTYGAGNSSNSIPNSCNKDNIEVESVIKHLTERLEVSRREQQDVDRQISEEETESKRVMAEIMRERDGLKQILKEKEETSSELRKQGNHLDKLNRTAQSRKAAKEKILQQKKVERQKMDDDIVRWSKEISEIGRDTQEMMNEKAEINAAKDLDIAEVRKGISEYQTWIKSLEEEIRIKGIQIKEIEKAREKPGFLNAGQKSRANKEPEENPQLIMLLHNLQQVCLSFLYDDISHHANTIQAQAENQHAQEQLAWWMARRVQDPGLFAPNPAVDYVPSLKPARSRRSRQVNNSHTSTVSNSSAGYTKSPTMFPNNMATVSPNYSVSTPFFNVNNGMTIPPNPDHTGMRQNDMETSTDGGPLSPAATGLLPFNLFRDEDPTGRQFSAAGGGHEAVGSVGSEYFAATGPLVSDAAAQGLHTPGSTRSQTGSLFSSPHGSLHNLHTYHSGAGSFADSDHQSINSTGVTGETNLLASRGIASLFGRQRGKSTTNEPPLLGALKPNQSHSFPRDLDDTTLGPIGSRRRRGSYSSWANPVAGLLNRSTTVSGHSPEDSGLISMRTGSGRRSRLNMFGYKLDGTESPQLADPSAPPRSRPSSMYSFDPALGMAPGFGWMASESIIQRNSHLGAGWGTSGGPWSRGQSRRASIQRGSNSNLSIGSTPLESENYLGSLTKQVPEQLPIGTRPQSSKRPVTPRLNPAAPSFKTLFGRGDGKRAGKADKLTDKSKSKELEKQDAEETDSQYEEWSPANARHSRDSQSVTTSTSIADSHDSLDRSTSGTPSEAVAGPKETLMQKITRKSSSSKFNIPFVKERGGGLFSNKRTGESSPAPDRGDEFSDSLLSPHQPVKTEAEHNAPPPPPPLLPPPPPPQQQQQNYSEKGGRSALSWQSIRRKSKKNNHARKDSETWDDDE